MIADVSMAWQQHLNQVLETIREELIRTGFRAVSLPLYEGSLWDNAHGKGKSEAHGYIVERLLRMKLDAGYDNPRGTIAELDQMAKC